MDQPSPCYLLQVPIEIRLQIYSHVIPSGTYTITAVPLDPPRALAEVRSETGIAIPGFLIPHEPVIRHGYAEELLLPNEKDTHRQVDDVTGAEEMRRVLTFMKKTQHAHADSKTGHIAGALWSHFVSDRWAESSRAAIRAGQASTRGGRQHTTLWDLDVADNVSAVASTAPPDDAMFRDQKDATVDLHDTLLALHQTCRTIHADLLVHFPNPSSLSNSSASPSLILSQHLQPRNIDFYLSFPAGVCVLANRFPHLLHRARNIRIAGVQELTHEKLPPYMQKAVDHQIAAIELITRSILGEASINRLHALRKYLLGDSHQITNTDVVSRGIVPRVPLPFSTASTFPASMKGMPVMPSLLIRIHHTAASYRNTNTYELVWTSPHTASIRAMQCVGAGLIDQTIWRSRDSTGVELKAVVSWAGLGQRNISMEQATPAGMDWDRIGSKWLVSGWEGRE